MLSKHSYNLFNKINKYLNNKRKENLCYLYLLCPSNCYIYSVLILIRDGYETAAAESDTEDSAKPLTRAELQNKVMDGVKRKEFEAHKEASQFDIEKSKDKTTQKQKQKAK